MNKTIIFLLIIFMLGCKKEKESRCNFDKLEGDLEILKGRWTWKYTVYKYVLASNNQLDFYDTLWPHEINKNFQIYFSNESYLELKVNDSLYDEGFFKKDPYTEETSYYEGYKNVNLLMNPCKNHNYSYAFMYSNNDTLLGKTFPFVTDEPYWGSIHNVYTLPSVFVKE